MKILKLNRVLAGAIPASLAFVAGQVIASEAPYGASASADDAPVIALAYAAEGGGGGEAAPIDESTAPTNQERKVRKGIIIKAIEPDGHLKGLHENTTWLGVSAEEASEVLSSQLGLDRGVGLVVNYVTPDSPAAKAGLQKNDLLVEFEGQSLVVPGQLRKLVQARKEGDEVNLVYFRAGKKETATVTLGKGHGGLELFGEGKNFEFDLHGLRQGLEDLPIRGALREQMQALRESLGNLKIDQKKVQEELRRSLEEARRAVERALKDTTEGAKAGMGPADKALKELERSEVFINKNPSVTVRSSGNSVKSLVKSDESGTVVIVWSPRPHLTAHDKAGKLLFDGEIATEEQREKVPRNLWERVEPMLDEMDKKTEE
jgi:hypothetical protein